MMAAHGTDSIIGSIELLIRAGKAGKKLQLPSLNII